MFKLFKKNYQEQLIKSIENNNISQLTNALLKGANVNIKNDNGESPLELAYRGRNEKIIRLILEAGANVNEKDEEGGYTLLMRGVEYLPYISIEIAQLLISKGIDINTEDKVGNTALSLALSYPDPDGGQNLALTYLLLNEGAIIREIDKQVFTNYFVYICGFAPIIKIVELFIEKGVDINALSDKGLGSETALQHAVYHGHMEIVEFLITKGADVNITKKGCYSALMTAIWAYLATLELDEIDNVRSSTGIVYCRNTVADRYLSIIKLLIENGADITYCTKKRKKGKTAFSLSSDSNNIELINILNSASSN